MIVRDLIKKLLDADMNVEVELAFKNGEFGDNDSEEYLSAVCISRNVADSTIYLCSNNRKADFLAIGER